MAGNTVEQGLSVPPDLTYLHGLPWTDDLPRWFGYTRPMPRVAFYWEGEHLYWRDARGYSDYTNDAAWHLYVTHPKVALFFRPYRWHAADEAGPTFFLVDRKKQRCAVGPIEQVADAIGPDTPLVPQYEAHYTTVCRKDFDATIEAIDRVDPGMIDLIQRKRTRQVRQLRQWLASLDGASMDSDTPL